MTAPRILKRTGGVFRDLHRELMQVDIDYGQLDVAAFPESLVAEARAVWHQRFSTEFRSIQIMNRFMGEVLAAGDPLEVYAGVVDLIADEVRHMALCADLLQALGGAPALPEPPEIPEKKAFLQASPPERALATAISMLAVNETLSVGFITDLQQRCQQPVVRKVLDATVADEEAHESFGWEYIKRSLQRFPISSLSVWRQIAHDALAPLRQGLEPVLARIPADRRHLDAWPDEDRVALGLYSPERQALVYQQTLEGKLLPQLRALNLV